MYCCFLLIRLLNSLNKLEEGGKNKPHLNPTESVKWLNEVKVKPLLLQSIIRVYFVGSHIKPILWRTLHTCALKLDCIQLPVICVLLKNVF